MMEYNKYDLEYIEADKLYDQEKYKEAFDIWLTLANKKHAPSMFVLYNLYKYGLGVTMQNNKEAYMWLEKSAEEGCLDAMYDFGTYCIDNNKIEKGIKYIKESADEGLKDSIYYIGTLYYNGSYGYSKDIGSAMKMFYKAFEAGKSEAFRVWMDTSIEHIGSIKTLWHIIKNIKINTKNFKNNAARRKVNPFIPRVKL